MSELNNSPTSGSATAATNAEPMGLPDFGAPAASGAAPSGIGLLGDVSLQVRIELGRTRMLVEDVLKLNADSVVELDKAAGDPVDIYVNGRRIARGEVLVLNENFCVRVSEILEPLEG
jgi:flagellar motor switch protein FliN/FliY